MDDLFRIGAWFLFLFVVLGCVPRGYDRYRRDRERTKSVNRAMQRLFLDENRKATLDPRPPQCCSEYAMHLVLAEEGHWVWWCEVCDKHHHQWA